MKLSVVIPVYNSEVTIYKLVYSLLDVLEPYDPEIVLVNDASKDNSESVCEHMAANDYRIKFISLRKNSGEHNAVICGLNFCSGDYAAIIDDDLQNPPSEIIRLLEKAVKDNHDVVYARYEVKQHSLFRNLASRMTNAFASHLISKPKGLYLSSFKLLHKDIIREVTNYKGPFPYVDALILRSTGNIGVETVQHENRRHGRSNYTIKKLVALYLNMFITFSNKPLRIVTIAGCVISVLSFLLSLYIVYEKLFLANITPGWSFLAILGLFSIGLTFIVMGLMGEYLGRILMSLNNTPQYTIKKKVNVEQFSENAIIAGYDR